MTENGKKAIIFIGIKHSGKTSAGRRLAKETGAVFYDIDDVIEKMTGETVRGFYKKNGKDAFMQAEKDACSYVAQKISESADKEDTGVVVSTGGGICDNGDALLILRQLGVFRYIDVSEETAFVRIKNKVAESGWPAFICGGHPESEEEASRVFHEFYVRRTQQYIALADETVSANS